MKNFLVGLLFAMPGLAWAGGSSGPNGGGGITIGSPISGTCTSGYVIYNNSGVLGCESVAGTGTVTSISAGTGLTASPSTITTTGSFSLANTAVTAAAYGSSTSIPSFTVNAQGQLTAAAGNAVVAPAGTLSGSTLASNVTGSSLTSVGTLAAGSIPFSLLNTLGTPANSIQYNGSGNLAGNTNHLLWPTALPVPANPTLSFTGTGGSRTRQYFVLPIGQLGYGLGTGLNAITNMPNTLDGSDYVTVATAAVTGSTSCDIWVVPNVTQAPGQAVYVANIPCGNTFLDKGAASSPPYPTSGVSPYGTTAFNQYDNSAGILTKNLIASGRVAMGDGPNLVLNRTNINTGGGATVTISHVSTDAGVAGSSLDPEVLLIEHTIQPTGGTMSYPNIAQPWTIQVATNVPATNTWPISAIEGITSIITVDGSGSMGSGDGVGGTLIIKGSVGDQSSVGILTPINGTNGGIVYESSGNWTNVVGLNGNVQHIGTGTITNAYGVDGSVTNGNGPITNAVGVHVEQATSTGIVNWCSICTEDNSGVGTSSSYGLNIKGATVKNIIAGALEVGAPTGGMPTSGINAPALKVNNVSVLTQGNVGIEIDLFYSGVPGNSAHLNKVFSRSTVVAASAPIKCSAQEGATSSATVTLYHVVSGTPTSVGTLVFGASGSAYETCTATFSSSVTFAAGDALTAVFPSTADATLGDIAISLPATQ